MLCGVYETGLSPVVETWADSSRALLDDAVRAFAAGRYERCLDLTEPLRTPDGEERRRRGMLRASALCALDRFSDALGVLDAIPEPPTTEGALALTALRARIALGSGDRPQARALLERARGESMTASPHARAELAFECARFAYRERQFEAAETALRDIPPGLAAWEAHASGLRAEIAFLRYDYDGAAHTGRAAIAHAQSLPTAHAVLEAGVLERLAVVAAERLDFALLSYVEQQAGRFDLAAPALELLAFRLHWARSVLFEANGEPDDALEAARSASRATASDALALFGRCRRAAVLLRYGERLAFRDLAASIRRQFAALDLAEIRDWNAALVPAVVAETLALMGDAEGAGRALQARHALVNLPDSPHAAHPAHAALSAYAEGALADASGSTLLAKRRYGAAFEQYREIGFTRRAMAAALRLADMTDDGTLTAYVERHARELSPRSWLRIRLAAAAGRSGNDVLNALSRAEREILGHLIDGRSTAEIAHARGRSAQTTRNSISKLFGAFGVDSRSALLREARRGGLIAADGAPAWEARSAM
jgi:DNA-binding CsgD family transcriptional regulator